MVVYADFHIHSKYALAVSKDNDLDHLAKYSDMKGLNVIGTGDFTHPLWFKSLAELKQIEDTGFYSYKDYKVKFAYTVEVATFDSTKRVHHVIHAPNREAAAQLNDVLGKRSKLASDGRPMLAKTTCAELVEMCKNVDSQMHVVAAHVWTPYFGALGALSGFNSMQDAYGDKAGKVLGIETGMSSTPQMNWRVKSLDDFAIMSGSDCHSYYLHRIGRECNAFSDDCDTYSKLFKAVAQGDKSKFLYTIETDPGYGKYHLSGHANCKFSCSYEESKKLNGICPVCHKKLTVGVENRVEELAVRSVDYVDKNRVPFRVTLPLTDLIASALGVALTVKKVGLIQDALIAKFGTEFNIVFNADLKEIEKITGDVVANAIRLNRDEKIKVTPGYDGLYGVLQLDKKEDISQTKLF